MLEEFDINYVLYLVAMVLAVFFGFILLIFVLVKYLVVYNFDNIIETFGITINN